MSVGASVAVFSVVDAVMLRPLPFAGSDRLVAIGEQVLKNPSPREPDLVAPQNFFDWRERQDVFSALAACAWREISV